MPARTILGCLLVLTTAALYAQENAPGAFKLAFSTAMDAGTAADGVLAEMRCPGTDWAAVPDLVVGLAPEDPAIVLAMAKHGWRRGCRYRVSTTPALADTLGRSAPASTHEFFAPLPTPDDPAPRIVYQRDFPRAYESFEAASDTVGGRFPGGQTILFHGMWTDPVSGHSYARNRWYDARNKSWLSEDPLRDIDSPNLYSAFGWRPHMSRDPLGTYVVKEQTLTTQEYLAELRSFERRLRREGRERGVWVNAQSILRAELARRTRTVPRTKGGRVSDNRFILIDDVPIDIKHFLSAARLAKEFGGRRARLGSYFEELNQQTHKAEGARRSSMSPEDMVSNVLGADFGAEDFDPNLYSLADQLEKAFQSTQATGAAREQATRWIEEIEANVPQHGSKEWLDLFDYDVNLTKPAPDQRDLDDFSVLERLGIKKVREHKDDQK